MIVVVQGTKNFDDYAVFLSGMRSALIRKEDDDKEFTVYSAGPLKVNNMAMEFINVTERTMKAQGIKTKLIKVPPAWIKQNFPVIDYFAFYCLPKEAIPDAVKSVSDKGVDVQVYRY
jgi:hypothetical protein